MLIQVLKYRITLTGEEEKKLSLVFQVRGNLSALNLREREREREREYFLSQRETIDSLYSERKTLRRNELVDSSS